MNIINDETSAGESAAVDQPQDQVDSSVEEPIETDNSSTETEQESDSFFDPNQVPEELKPAYKQMQAAFTKKTQEIAQAKKENEAFQQKAQEYDKVAKYLPLLEEMEAGRQSDQGNKESSEMVALTQRLKAAGYGDDAIEMMKLGAQFTLDQFNRYQQIQDVNQQTAFVESKIAESATVDQRLNDPNLTYDVDGEKVTFGQLVEQLVISDSKWTKDPVAATKRAIKTVDALIGRAKTEGKQELSATAKNQAAKFPRANSSSQGAVDKSQPLSMREAFKQAQEELG